MIFHVFVCFLVFFDQESTTNIADIEVEGGDRFRVNGIDMW